MSCPAKRQRISVKLKTPNPLFEQWLTEWRDKSREIGSKMENCFNLALKALQKYPLPLETGKDCKMLHGFGDKLCRMLDDRLKKHREENPSTGNEPKQRKRRSNAQIAATPKSPREYIPQHRSGAYAILVTLYEKSLDENFVGFLNKKSLIELGQHLSDKSFTRSEPETRYTAWSSMKTLLEKGLVKKQGNPARFSLTPAGSEMAQKIYVQKQVDGFISETNTLVLPKTKEKDKILVGACAQPSTSRTTSMQSFESVVLPPNSFKIFLIVDNCEVSSKNQNAILAELDHLKVPYDVKDLKVGDFVWLCRDNNSSTELVLPYIIERKRMDDLGSSIKDGRFHEQKFRLKQSGIANRIYLVENYGRNEHVGLPLSTLFQAATNTLVQDGFSVKITRDLRGTAKYLACMTKLITKLFKSKTIASCAKDDLENASILDDFCSLMHFAEFNKSSTKSKALKVSDVFIKQLLQIKGLSVDKACGITDKYPTPRLLKDAYDELSPADGEKLLANVPCGEDRKNFGLVLIQKPGADFYGLFSAGCAILVPMTYQFLTKNKFLPRLLASR